MVYDMIYDTFLCINLNVKISRWECLSCDDEAPFGNSEYIRKIRAKNAKMASLDPNLSSKVYRSASTRRRTQLGASCQNLQPVTTRLRRSQSLKTVETLV